jgi:hypothetical protein
MILSLICLITLIGLPVQYQKKNSKVFNQWKSKIKDKGVGFRDFTANSYIVMYLQYALKNSSSSKKILP